MEKPYVLVVDDNRITTKLLRRYLESHGFETQEAFDGVDCIEKISQRLPDAVVLDVMMPRMDGFETVKAVRASAEMNKVPVVVVTALNDVSNQVKAIESGADDFLSKPIEEKLLVAKVRLLTKTSRCERHVAELAGALQQVIGGTYSTDSLEEALRKAGIEPPVQE